MKIDMKVLKSRVGDYINFSFFRDGQLWYVCNDGWEFPIPVEDTNNAQGSAPTFSAQMKGISLMRWVRKRMQYELELKLEAESSALAQSDDSQSSCSSL